MAVAFSKSAAGRKTATTGTTFTIALSSNLGETVLVSICQPSGASAVSSVTDGGGNTYHKVGNLSNTVVSELWKSDKVNAAASGTITVTVVTGFLADGCAASYSGVAYAGEASATNSASSATFSSGARTLRETLGTGEVVTGGGSTGNAAFTVSTGNLRQQGTGVTGSRSLIMDSQGNGSPVTNAATMTSTTWSAVSVELRPMQVTDTMTMSDGTAGQNLGLLRVITDTIVLSENLGLGYGNSIPDVLELLDADSGSVLVGKQDIDYNGWAHWCDGFRMFISNTVTGVTAMRLGFGDGNQRAKVLSVSGNPSVTLTETLVWQDGAPAEFYRFGLGIICPHLADNLGDVLSSQSGIVKSLTDTFTITDSLGAGYGNSTSDQLIIVDSLGAGYGGVFSDSNAVNWLDADNNVLGILVVLSDTDSTWADFVAAGYGLVKSDQIVIVDSLSSGYGAVLSDQLVFADSPGIGYGIVLSDTDATWLDFLGAGYGNNTFDQIVIVDSLGAGYGAVLSDNDNFWLDAFADQLNNSTLQLTLTLSDNEGGNWLDAVFAGYGNATSDQLIIVDSLGAGYGAVLSDNLNNWLDLDKNVLGLGVIIADTDTTWLDTLGLGYGNSILDQLVVVDSLAAGYGNSTSDQIIFVDSLGAGYAGSLSDQMNLSDTIAAGYGDVVVDSLNNWLDLESNRLGLIETLTDTLNNWLDGLGVGYGNATIDQLTMSDTLFAGYGNATSDQIVFVDSIGAGYSAGLFDQMTMSDSLAVGYGFGLTDNLNNWLDAATLTFGFGLSLVDTDSAWLDSLLAGYGNSVSDQIVIVDSLGAGYGFVLSDNLNFWQDSVVIFSNQPGLQLTLSDDGENNWLDRLGVGYGNATSDQMVILDSLGAGYGAVLSDNANFWSDAGSNVLGILKSLSDSANNLADVLGVGYGNATSDQLIIVDSLGAGYGAVLSDSLNNWLDQFSDSLIGNNINVILSDTLTMFDQLGVGYGSGTSDQLGLLDSVGLGYGLLASDSGNSWLDAYASTFGLLVNFSDSLNFWLDSGTVRLSTALILSDSFVLSDSLGMGYGYNPSDQLPMQDALAAGYGFIIGDSGFPWLDFFTTTGLFPYTIDLNDSIAFWDDSISQFNAANVGPAKYTTVRIFNSVAPGYILVTAAAQFRAVKIARDPLVITGYGSATADSESDMWFDQLNISVSAAAGLGLDLSDSGSSFWLDSAAANNAFSGAFSLAVSDAITIQDALGLGYGWKMSDALQFSDNVLAIDPLATLILQLSDSSASWLDVTGKQMTMNLSALDSLNSWSDLVVDTVVGALINLNISDSVAWTDSLAKQFSLRKVITDTTSAMTDGASHSVIATLLSLQFNESLNNWLDFVPGFVTDYGAGIGDTLGGNWSDTVTRVLN